MENTLIQMSSLLIPQVVPYISLEPRQRVLAFLALNAQPKFLQKDSESYWGHLTMDAIGVYESIYEACADQQTGLVSCKYQIS
jgi:hypothetical protein